MDKIKRAMPFCITAIIILTVFIIQFAVLEPQSATGGFWINLGVNAALIVAMSLTWMASGSDRAKGEEKSAYKTNAAEYAKRIAAIEERGQLAELSEFCEKKTRELLEERMKGILAQVGIDWDRFDELKGLSAEKLRARGLVRKQIRAIMRIRNGGQFPERLRRNSLKVRPIRALELTTNHRVRNRYDVVYNEEADKAVSVLIRAAKSILTGAALAYISFQLAGNITDLTAWAAFLMKLATIFYTAWSSEREGYSQIAVTKNRVILCRLSFLSLFNEWVKVPKLGEGKGEGERTREE